MSSRGVSRQTSAAASPMSAKPRSLKGSHTPSPARAGASAAATATAAPSAAQQPARLHPDWDRLSLEDSLLLADTSLTAKERRLIRRSITIRNRRLRSGLGLGLSLGSGAASVAAPMPPAPSAGVPAGSAAVAVPRVPPIVIAAPPSAPVAPSNSRSLAASRRRSSAATTKALAAAAAASAAFAAANAAPPTDEIKTESETAPAQPTPRHMVIPIPPHTAHRRPTNFRAAIEQRRNNLQAFLRRISTPTAPGDTAMLTVSQQQQQQQQQDEQIRTDPLVANTLSAAAVMVPDLSTMWSAHCASMTPTVKVHTVWTPPTLLPLSKLSLSHSLERFGSSGNVSMERVSSTATDSGLPHPLLSKDMMDDSGGRGDENGFATPTDAWMASRRLLEDATGAASSGDAAVSVETTTEERELAHQLLVYYMLMNTAAAAVADAAADAAAVARTSTPPPPSCL
ncbi:hypothetical protein BC831DRAFT_467568 [Entophlyctis helioformis]|nr:hypothetical protein BC831DRAFT_467568 [Entophlyctis helioformis]